MKITFSGLISVVGNVVVFSYNIRQVWLNRVDMSKISYNHRLLVISLASADLLLGVSQIAYTFFKLYYIHKFLVRKISLF